MTPKQNYRYWILWRDACQKRAWDQGDSQLRHEVHVQALGCDKSHLAMDNKDVDRIFRFLTLLADPDNLEAAVFFQDPEKEERKRLLFRIEELASKRYIESISADVFGTIYYSDLDEPSLKQLRNMINSRMRAQRRHAAASARPSCQQQLVLA